MMTDGAGQEVSETVAAQAVEQFAELWGNALFDCGPQDYEFMASEILAKFRAGDTRELKAALKQTICDHVHTSGGNDYMLCSDCELEWDYRRTTAKLALKAEVERLLGEPTKE